MKDNEKERVALESTEDKEFVVSTDKKSGAEKKLDKKKLVYLFSTIGFSVFFCTFYYCSMEISSRNPKLYYFFPAVMFSYMAILTVLMLVYIIYNRGFSRKGVTVEMLPDEWSDEQKQSFIEDGELRIRRSKWMLVLM